jgi:hypothetical protein
MPTIIKSRALQNDLDFVERQIEEHSDPYDTVRLMWEQRRKELLEEIEALTSSPDVHAEVALLFAGNPVHGSEEIRLDFATRALDNYQQVVSVLAAERAGTAVGSRGRLPQSFSSRFFIREMIRGSVGFLLEEAKPSQNALLVSPLKDAVRDTMQVLEDLSSSDVDRFNSRLQKLGPRAVNAIKRMAKVLGDAGAEASIVNDEVELNLNRAKTEALITRLGEIDVQESRETMVGTLLGIFPERRQYEFAPLDGGILHGPISEELDARYLADPTRLLLRPCTATFSILKTLRGGQIQGQELVLEEIEPVLESLTE